jgi:hypothetical protein
MTRSFFTLLLLVSALVASAQDAPTITSKYDFVPGEKVIFFDDFTSVSPH